MIAERAVLYGRRFFPSSFDDSNIERTRNFRFKQRLDRAKAGEAADVDYSDKTTHDFHNCVETGFQLATFQGPLCAEPVEGVAYFFEDMTINDEGLEKEIGSLPIRFVEISG